MINPTDKKIPKPKVISAKTVRHFLLREKDNLDGSEGKKILRKYIPFDIKSLPNYLQE